MYGLTFLDTGMQNGDLAKPNIGPVGNGQLMKMLITLDLFCFVFYCLRPKPTALVMAGRSVHLTTLFPGQALTSS